MGDWGRPQFEKSGGAGHLTFFNQIRLNDCLSCNVTVAIALQQPQYLVDLPQVDHTIPQNLHDTTVRIVPLAFSRIQLFERE